MPSSALFWPSGRRLFRKRSRLRTLAWVAAAAALGVAVGFWGQLGWA